jgi:alkaline phosphatase D
MLNRRNFIAGAAASWLAAPAILSAQGWRRYPFSLGVAAGDPSPDGFVIWTRLAPEPLAPDFGMAMEAVAVRWEVASDERFASKVAEGEALARPELGHSVHVEVAGLQPDRTYWYRFNVPGERSIQGRARTLPAAGSSPHALRFGVAGCQSWEDGLYTAHRHLAREEDLAFVYHYGDYIYEYRGGSVRPGRGGGLTVSVREAAGDTLYDVDDYRRRYGQYKSDPDLQRAHAAHAFFHSFDDHEVADNWVGDVQGRDTPPEIFRLRRAAALQAWYEHMPVRRAQMPRYGEVAMHRAVRYGDLAEIDILDTRQFRSNQPCDDGFKPLCPDVRARAATVLGAEQEQWLSRNLARNPARWNVLAQQIMMMSLDRRTREDEPAEIRNMDSWAAYDVPRERLLARMAGLGNVIVLTGDEHQNFAGLLHDGERAVAAEFVATSISSGGDGQNLRPGSDRILANNPELKFVNDQRGYLTFDVSPDEWRTNYMVVDKVSTPGGTLSKRATVSLARGTPALTVA